VTLKILYIDMDNVLVNFPTGIAKTPPDLNEQFEGHLDDIPGILSLMDPVEGAVQAFNELSSLFDIYILSTAERDNPSARSAKLLWVKRHLDAPAYKRLIPSYHKNLNDGHFLVDDRTKNGADRFRGEHIHFTTPAFPDWGKTLSYLKTKS
jgi:5'-nucleotidase